MTKKVSIILVTYNAAKTVEKTLQSIIAQTYKNIEFIVIDGDSTDGTKEILKKYEANIDTLISEPDKGIYDAMNKGLAYATGDYVYFIGGDDSLALPESFESLFEQNPDADIILTSVNVVDSADNLIYLREQLHLENKSSLLLDFVSHQGMFVKLEKIKQAGGFDVNYRLCADYDQFLKIALKLNGTIAVYSLAIANYAADGASSVTNPERVTKVNAEFEKVRRKYRSWWQNIKSKSLFKKAVKSFRAAASIVRVTLNIFTVWTIVFWWAYLRLILRKNKSNRVLIIPEFSSHGGTRTYLIELIEYYSNKNFEVGVLLNEEQASDNGFKDYTDKFNVKRLFSKKPNRLLSWLGSTLWTANIIKQNMQVLSAIREFKPALTISSVATNQRDLHLFLIPMRFLYILHMYPVTGIGLWNRLLLRLNLSNQKRLVTVSNYCLNTAVQQWKIPKSEYTSVIYNFSVNNGGDFEKSDKKDNKSVITIFTAALVEDYKAPDFWVKVAKSYLQTYPDQNVEFKWAGGGKLISYCRSYTQEYSKSIQFLGQLNQEQLAEQYKAADIYMQPSRMESFGISVVDAMSYSLPAIVSGYTALGETIEHGESGIVVQSEDVDEYVAAVHNLVTDNNLRAKMAKNAKQRAKNTFSKLTWSQAMDRIHNQITN